MMKDLYNNIATPAVSITSALIASTATGTGVDLQGHEGCVVVFVPATKTDGTHTPKIQDSNDNSTFADVAAADQLGTLSALASNTVQKVGYIGNKRYVRAVVTVTGSPSTGCVFGAQVIRGFGRRNPLA